MRAITVQKIILQNKINQNVNIHTIHYQNVKLRNLIP